MRAIELPVADLMEPACIAIDHGLGEVVDSNSAAARMLGTSADDLRGQSWRHALGIADHCAAALQYAMSSGRRVALPPFLVHPAGAHEVVVDGLVCPAPEGAGTCLLQLWENRETLLAGLAPRPADTLAVLGIDWQRHDAELQWSAMGDAIAGIRASALDIVRSRDAVSPAAGTSLVLVLRDIELSGARDICIALLSHLHRLHGAGLHMCVGMARAGDERSALAALLAANSAMLQCAASGSGEQVRAEAHDDYPLLVTAATARGGVFGGEAPVGESVDAATGPDLAPPVKPIERDIEGYVVDNMEGAVDQALFLADLDIPVAIIGPAGTGKMYVARIMHEHGGGAPDMLSQLDCREFRSRNDANRKIGAELVAGQGRTLVFKSPHLMNGEAQARLARQIASRRLADTSPPEALPRMRLIGLFPDSLERLVRRGQLHEHLASVFAGMPINVPPIRDRKQAVLRWAHKILGQEGARRDRDMKGFTSDAERAMLLYDWPGNISEMRQCICDALDKTDKNWLTPVDLGLFKGIDPEGAAALPESLPFLEILGSEGEEQAAYTPTTLESLDLALAEAVHSMLQLDALKPLGTWMEDDLVTTLLERYRGDLRRTAEFLHTRPRNVSRWMEKIGARDQERNDSALWQEPRRHLREWARESQQLEESPMQMLYNRLLRHVEEQGGGISAGKRALIMGVSTPTYTKRLRERDAATATG